jgi:hypothetical protein
MRTIETTVTVGADRTLSVQLPEDVPPGTHRVVLVIETAAAPEAARAPLTFSAYPVGLASDEFTFRREDLYDDGR